MGKKLNCNSFANRQSTHGDKRANCGVVIPMKPRTPKGEPDAEFLKFEEEVMEEMEAYAEEAGLTEEDAIQRVLQVRKQISEERKQKGQ